MINLKLKALLEMIKHRLKANQKRVGDNVYVDPKSLVGGDCTFGSNVVVKKNTSIKSTKVGRYSYF